MPPILRAAQGLAVYGHHIRTGRQPQTLQPLLQQEFQRLGGQQPQHPVEGIARGDAVRQFQPPCKPFPMALPEGCDPRHVIRPAQAGTDRDQENVLQPVAPPAPRARVLHMLKQRLQRNRGLCVHMCFFVVSEPMPAIIPYWAQTPHSATLR